MKNTLLHKRKSVHQTGGTPLFAELCVRLAEPGGRIGIILPNGYLGNRGIEYVALREWLLKHTRLAGIVGFPRFTFKKSGADVSASAVFLEKRKRPLETASESEDYSFFVGNIESVGWRAGDKTAVPIYLRDPETGDFVLDEENEPILDADFGTALDEFLRSPAADTFAWVARDRDLPKGAQTWSVDIAEIAQRPDLNLDPKRHSFKLHELQQEIMSRKHFRLADALDAVANDRFDPIPSHIYRYVEIEKIGSGDYDFTELRGWELPQRAKLRACPGDLFIPHVWGCAGKWFIASSECDDLVVTNGCTRLRVRDGKENYLPDLLAGLCSEAFAVQMRGFATGSDGLAEIGNDDLLNIVLPRILSKADRERLEAQIDIILAGESRFARVAKEIIGRKPSFPVPPRRKSHCSLV